MQDCFMATAAVISAWSVATEWFARVMSSAWAKNYDRKKFSCR